MRVLGVDPGTIAMGYGVIESDDTKVTLVCCGALKAPAAAPIAERLSLLYAGLMTVIGERRPEVMAVEQPFFAKNARSALAIGRAQAIAILAGANNGLLVHEYTPAQIKQRVANYGASSKEQIQEMVRLQLGLRDVPQPSDAADALATALCHLGEMRFTALTARGR